MRINGLKCDYFTNMVTLADQAVCLISLHNNSCRFNNGKVIKSANNYFRKVVT